MNGEMGKFIKDLAERVAEGDKARLRNEHAIKFIDRLIEIEQKQGAKSVVDILESIRGILEQ